MSIREWFPLFALLEALIRYIDFFKTLIRSQRRVVNKWGPPRPLTHHYIAYDVRNIVCNGTAAWKNHVYRLWMNGTISIKPFILYSLPFSSALPWDELALYGRRLEWVEPRTNLPPHPLTKQASEHCHYFKIMWHLYYDPPRRDRECNRSQDIHWFARCRYFKLLLRSMELRWNVRLVKKYL